MDDEKFIPERSVYEKSSTLFEKLLQLQNEHQKLKDTLDVVLETSYDMWMFYIASGLNNASDKNITSILEDFGKTVSMLAKICGSEPTALNHYVNVDKEMKKVQEIVNTCPCAEMDMYDICETCNEESVKELDKLREENKSLRNSIYEIAEDREAFEKAYYEMVDKLKQYKTDYAYAKFAKVKLQKIEERCHRISDTLYPQTNPLSDILQIIEGE